MPLISDDVCFPKSNCMHDIEKWIKQADKLDDIIPLCKERHIALDVGANIGLWSRKMAEAFTTVIAFEPDSDNTDCHIKNTYGHTNIVLFEAPVTRKERMVRMLVRGAHYAREAHDEEQADYVKMSMTIDGLRLDRVGLLKVDVDGMDLEVLEGAAETIERCHPVVCVETKGPKKETRPIRQFLIDRGYELAFINKPDEVYVHATDQ